VAFLVKNFQSRPILASLPEKFQKKIIDQLGVVQFTEEYVLIAQLIKKILQDLPLNITANLIDDESYWKRCCTARWPLCDVTLTNNSYKRFFFEANLQGKILKIVF
jgi:hypothetical protein